MLIIVFELSWFMIRIISAVKPAPIRLENMSIRLKARQGSTSWGQFQTDAGKQKHSALFQRFMLGKPAYIPALANSPDNGENQH